MFQKIDQTTINWVFSTDKSSASCQGFCTKKNIEGEEYEIFLALSNAKSELNTEQLTYAVEQATAIFLKDKRRKKRKEFRGFLGSEPYNIFGFSEYGFSQFCFVFRKQPKND